MAKGGSVGAMPDFTPVQLPSGYTQVEYIESTGTQSIDTGFVPGGDDFTVQAIFKPTLSLADTNYLVTLDSGLDESAGIVQFGIRNSAYICHVYNVGYLGNSPATNLKVDITFKISGSQLTMSGDATFTVTNTFLSTGAYRNHSMTVCEGNHLCYGMKIYRGTALALHFIPCVNPSGEIGLFDQVTNTFYGNSGTGEYVAGPEYISMAKKVKKGYLGVFGIARKIKKAYMGVGGVAKLIWGRGELLYYGTATALSYSRGALAATTVGNYALFGGGSTLMSSHISSRATSTVNAYDSSLTMSVVTSLTTSRSWLSAASIGGYAIFAGGSESTRADGYNGALTRISVPNLSEGKDHMASTTVGDYVLFSTGRATGDDEYGTDYATYNLDAYNSALTKSSFRWAGYYLFSRAATTVGGYALFGGGTQYISGSTSVVAIDASLTQTSASPMTTGRISPGAASVGNYALFGGGESSNNKYTDTVDAYTASLTKSTASPLSIARAGISGISLGDFALFAGGGISAITTYNNVDSYDASLTKTTSTPLNTARQHLAATKLNNYALFGGGFTTSNSSRSAVVDVYQLV